MGALKPWHVLVLLCDMAVTVGLIVAIVLVVRTIARKRRP